MCSNVLDRKGARNNLVGLQVWYLQLEFLLERHDNLHGVQTIKPQIILEMSARRHLKEMGEKEKEWILFYFQEYERDGSRRRRKAASAVYLGRIDLRVALDNVDDSFDDLLPGEMVVAVGRHGSNGGVEAGEGPRAVKGLDRDTKVTQDSES